MFPQAGNTPPSWVLPGAGLDLDFKNNRYWGGYINRGTGNNSSLRSGTLMSAGNGGGNYAAPNSRGLVTVFPQYTPRITDGFGLWNEGPNTNYALQSRDLSNAAWTKTNMTAARTQVGADQLTNGATLLTATAANATCFQAITLASTQVIGSAYIRRVTGTGTIEMTMDGGATYTNITSQINSNSFTWVEVVQQTLTNPSFGLRIVTSGDAVAVDFTQLENTQHGNLKATTPIITTTATATRGNELPQFGTTSTSFNDGLRIIDFYYFRRPVSIYMEASGNGTSGTVSVMGGGNFSNHRITGVVNGTVGTHRTATSATLATTVNSGVAGRGNINKLMVRTNGFGNAICLNGGAIATGPGSPDQVNITDNHCGFGNRGAADQSINGYIGRATFFPYDVSDAQMIQYTT